jgi:molybdenum cofactor guanylyltransferase
VAGPTRSQITGLVLAGGRGVRMGGADKGWVVYEGQPLVQTTIRRLVPQVGAVLISANRNVDAYRALAEVVTDADAGLALEPYPGPLAGVLAGLRRAATPWVAVVPCDAPALPHDLVEQLATGLRDEPAGASYANAEKRAQPVFALVPRGAAASLQSFMEEGGRAMGGWLAALGAVPVEFEDAHGFSNVNSLPGMQPVAPRTRS